MYDRHDRVGLLAAGVVLVALCSVGGRGAESSPAAGATGAESLAAWKFVVDVPIDQTADARLVDLLLTPSIFDGARLDLADLRLYDDAGREVPYALRVRRPIDTTITVEASPINRVRDAAGGSKLSLDFGEGGVEHNEVEVKTPGTNFRRRIVLEGSDDNQTWDRLAEEDLIHFQAGDRELRDETVGYTPCRYRYLRMTVSRDPQVDKDREAVPIGEVTVRRRVTVPGEIVTRPGALGPRDAVRVDGAAGSAWVVDLGGDAVPCDRVLVEVADGEFNRDYRVECAGKPDSGQPFRRIASGVWSRRAGQRTKRMEARFAEVQAARLKLLVIDHRNRPLQIQSVQVGAPARVVIARQQPTTAGPWHLYFGNADAEPPNYDFARNLPKRLDAAPMRFAVGQRRVHPGYKPEPLPLTERLPWLIYVLLGIAVAVLGALIVSLARTAIAVDDARHAVSD